MNQRRLRDLSKYRSNPHIDKVSESNIQFTTEFKIKSIKQYQSGQSPVDIFIEAGIDLSDFNRNYASKTVRRWVAAAEEYGLKNINKERRGVGSSGRPSSGKKFKSLEEEIVYLRAENDFLKKIRALGKAPGVKKNIK